MFQQHYFIPKHSGTLSDTLLAFGVAETLGALVQQQTGNNRVSLQDTGSCFVVDTGMPIDPAWVETSSFFEQVRFLSGTKFPIPADLPMLAVRNVDEEWDRFKAFLDQRDQLRVAGSRGDELEMAVEDLAPVPDWGVVTYLTDYRMQAQGIHNGLVEQWRRSGEHFWQLNLRTILALFESITTDWDEIAADWKNATKAANLPDTVTASQLFNPHMGKGQNRAKANGLSMGNEKSFWLVEYLKVVGLWTATAPSKISNADLRKTYVLAPASIQVSFHDRVMKEFRQQLRNDSAIKQDVRAVLLYAETLLKYAAEEDAIDLFGGGPLSNLVAGMDVATYQLLSRNSYTMMNLSFLGLPDWMPSIRSADDAWEYKAILQEHGEHIRSIDEATSEGYALLKSYRDFVSGQDFDAFFDFAAAYSSYLISQIDRSHFYVKPFNETNLRRLFEMSKPELSAILQNEGFRNIAAAIRSSTVLPLYLGRKVSRFDVRYGLGQDLKRRSQYPDDFIQALSDFMQSYNDETMRVHERTKGQARRKLITTGDIEGVVGLIDVYGSKTVCNLLVAFGYARDPKEKTEEEAVASAGEQESV